MALLEQQRVFLERRRRLLRWWPVVGWLLLVASFGLALWLLVTAPLLINPVAAAAAIESEQVPWPTIEAMAALLPYASLLALALLVVLVLFMFAAMAQQRRLLALIDSQQVTTSDGNGAEQP
jgi:hypothetical protein